MYSTKSMTVALFAVIAVSSSIISAVPVPNGKDSSKATTTTTIVPIPTPTSPNSGFINTDPNGGGTNPLQSVQPNPSSTLQ
ncbi:hypothetical protein BJ085DRAFT_36983 [Dimargaris cristalligena]|uniref:Uncharacterized protein n=1 Tax=Dimargaris cristalligena TaxID=215637 RepID=A0A4P9ZMR0_9FUNG|nr:hypothetical protein BJ085DRAFT_36983 [Dimargaris cristalligena]|eukprot:RKP33812.1 hypothetical protein BJ085DRAFT_36983 [Dimargaris cristalligena]